MTKLNVNVSFNEMKKKREWHLLIFLKRMRPVDWALASTNDFGMNSTLTRAPLPSNLRGVTRNVAPSKNVSGNFSSILWLIMKLLNLPASASVTSSNGVSKKNKQNGIEF